MLKKILLSFLVLLPVLALSQQQGVEQTLKIRNIKGLNTRAGIFTLEPNELTMAYNVDFRKPGSVTKRKGYDSVSVLPGMDSIVDGGIFAVAYSDGTQQLVIVADSAGVGYGAVYLSPLGSANIKDSATKIWDYFSVQNRPSFEQYLDRVYIGNGSHRPIVYDKNSGLTRQVPPGAPGEPLIIPLNTVGDLNGEYVYRTRLTLAPDFADAGYNLFGNAPGFVSHPVKVLQGQVLLRDFSRPIPLTVGDDQIEEVSPWYVHYVVDIDSVANNTDYWVWINDDSIGYMSDGTADEAEIVAHLRDSINMVHDALVTAGAALDSAHSYFVFIRSDTDFISYACSTTITDNRMHVHGDSSWILWIERTPANPGILDESDSVGIVKSQEFFYYDTLKIDTFWVIDSSANLNLSDQLIDRQFHGLDSSYTVTYRYGAPGFLNYDIEVPDSSAYGVYGGWPLSQDQAVGVLYACTFMDTITGLESDRSRFFAMWKHSTNQNESTFTYTISLPRIPVSNSGFKINLYRAMLTAVRGDTLWLADTTYIEHESRYYVYDTGYGGVERHLETEIIVERDIRRWVDGLELDSVYRGRLVFLKQFDDTVRVHIDSLRYDSLINRGTAIYDEYEQISAPPLMRGMFSFQNRMFAYQGNRLYYSDLDNPLGGQSIDDWHEWDHIVVAEGDGDEIVYAHTARDYIRVFKHNSSYIIYLGDDGFQLRTAYDGIWPHVDYVGAYGCLSPQSFIDAPEGSYYFSNLGVLRENAGQQLARQRDTRLVSAKLDNFDDLSIDDKEDAVAAYIPSEQIYMLCIGDTSYVYFARADAWATWGFTFSGSALYRVEGGVNNYPGDTLYFIKPGMSGLYRYGTSEYDGSVNGGYADSFAVRWMLAPCLVDNHDYGITAVGIWGQPGYGGGDAMTFTNLFKLIGYDEGWETVFIRNAPSLSDVPYLELSIEPYRSLALYFSINIWDTWGTTHRGQYIDGLDVFYIDQGRTERK